MRVLLLLAVFTYMQRPGGGLQCYQCSSGHEGWCSLSPPPRQVRPAACSPGRELAPLLLGVLPAAPAPLPGLLSAMLAAAGAVLAPDQRDVACLKLVTRAGTVNETTIRFCASRTVGERLCEAVRIFTGNSSSAESEPPTPRQGVFCGLCTEEACNAATLHRVGWLLGLLTLFKCL